MNLYTNLSICFKKELENLRIRKNWNLLNNTFN